MFTKVQLSELATAQAAAFKAYSDARSTVIDVTDPDAVVALEIHKQLKQREADKSYAQFQAALSTFIASHPDSDALQSEVTATVDASAAKVAAGPVITPVPVVGP